MYSIKRWLIGIGVIAFLSVSTMIIADQADSLDLHSNVKAAYGIADVSSAVCVEVDASGNLQTDVNAIVPGVGATDLGKAEDAAHTSGDVGVEILSVRKDTAAALAGTDADYQPLITDANGRLHVVNPAISGLEILIAGGATQTNDVKVTLDSEAVVLGIGTASIGKLAANTGVDIGDVDILSLPVGTAGMIASTPVTIASDDVIGVAVQAAVELTDDVVYVDDADWVDSTDKHALVGGLYQSTPQTVTDGDVAPIQIDANGNQVVVGAGTAGTAAGGVTTIQGVGSMTPVIVSNATASSLLTENSPAAKTGTVEVVSGVVKAAPGTVYAVLVSGAGVTAADQVELYNSPTSAAGDALFTVVADAANGTWAFYPCVGVTFDSGIYYEETKSGGTFTTTVVYE